jgi:hypothetical protein
MKNLKYTLLGFTIGLLIFSLVEKLFEVIILWLESLKIPLTKKILKGNVEMQPMKEFLKPVNPVYDEYDDDEDK